ncbi:uncharacterized protein FA14DRAFT_118818 [Meira miltonrushii]|uniref:Uncharacterized protein n=1 Tax=Meira miltonrushii TaxID=1280837 RepID=A0A316VNX0_9BASI|nr:uncharacterized protein FA14DRAFT_118818 [Meira miltonrushii]PWN37821.1 hypothetical protein FA14DRAFT_118818 [Meira miltonrushii]
MKEFKLTLRRDSDTSKGGRKRKRVDYAGMGGGQEDDADGDAGSGSDSDGGPSKKKKTTKGKKVKGINLEGMGKGIGPDGASLIKIDRRRYEVAIKEGGLKRQFHFPTMRRDGQKIEFTATRQALGTRLGMEIPPRPLHDPMGASAIVLFDPTVDDIELTREQDRLQKIQADAEAKLTQDDKSSSGSSSKKEEPSQKLQPDQTVHKNLADILGIRRRDANAKPPKVPVVIDPRLTAILRPHQVEGVKFLYRCATGLIQEGAFGSIMADGMGLGKTLQCISLMWTLLKQSPTPGKPTIEKCIIACPSTLVRNWANEMTKWLKEKAPGLLVIDGSQTKEQMIMSVHRWCNVRGKSVTQPVMIVSYETLRNLVEVLGEAEVGLLLCDEGHRLKNSDSLTYKALDQIKVKRRCILSGTPIQNDLTEYFALISFANPDLLGGRLEFHKKFEKPILEGRDSEASKAKQELGDQKLKELSELVSKFIIRRSNELNTKYLPVKYEHVVFCRMSGFQQELYRYMAEKAAKGAKANGGKTAGSLKAINELKKLCNHPDLLEADNMAGAEKLFPPGYKTGVGRFVDFSLSGKTEVLQRFLQTIRRTTKDKVVLISNYTQTLDIFERMCRQNSWKSFRLDGTMTINKRQKYVDDFNNPDRDEFIFLLSSKAGGCGINLIGANRLVLFDPDWNPASDQQALARVWREGQTKECFVYRFIGTGSIEEKILQRQLNKQALSKCVVDQAENQERQFTGDDLRRLFKYKDKTECETHDTIKCGRCKDGKQTTKAMAMLNEDASTWNHYGRNEFKNLHDDLLRNELAYDIVSFVFQFCSV